MRYLCWISFELQVHYNKDNYVIVQTLLSNTCDSFSRISEVFNEKMEMEINITSNNIVTKIYLRIRLR